MTGFAFGEVTAGSVRMSAELKSYNNRYLDLIVGLPPPLASWEPAVRELLAGEIARGRVEFTIRIKEAGGASAVEVDETLARQYKQALQTLQKLTGAKGPIRLEHLASLPGVLSPAKELDPAVLRATAEQLQSRLMMDFQAARVSEGKRLEADIRRQLEVISEGRRVIAERATAMEASFRETLQRRFRELAAEADENRILAETALLLVRYGINEELVRLESHEKAFRDLLTDSAPVGKKLDFLCQELGREINTIGSKTTFADVQQRVVAMKDALENLREQLRNVE